MVCLAACAAVWADQDCPLANRYVALAQQRISASATDEAAALLQQAIDACPSYDAFQTLGELEAQLPQRAEHARAVDAFVAAHQLAPSSQARARSLYTYAHLLTRDGDPQNAYPLIRDAKVLDPRTPRSRN